MVAHAASQAAAVQRDAGKASGRGGRGGGSRCASGGAVARGDHTELRAGRRAVQGLCLRLDAGGDDGDPHLAFQRVVEGGAEDDVGVGIDFLADAVGRLVNLEQGHVRAAGDVDQQAARALHRGVVEQRVVDRRLCRVDGPAVAGGLASAHHRLAHLAHDRADVGEVQVDQARHDHQVGHAAHAGMQHIVGHLEGVGESGLLVRHPEQVLVRDDDEGIDILLQFLDAGFGKAHAVMALEMERLGDHANRQDVALACRLGDDRCRTGAGAAAHASGDEAHVGAFEVLQNLVDGGFRRRTADFRPRTRAQTLRDRGAELDTPLGNRLRDRLRIGVGNHELDPGEVRADHVVDRVTAGTADTDHGDPRLQVRLVR